MHAQFVREFAKLGLTRTVGGVLGLALARELTPVVTSIILAGAAPRWVCSGGMVGAGYRRVCSGGKPNIRGLMSLCLVG